MQYQTIHLAAHPIEVEGSNEPTGTCRVVSSEDGASTPEVLKLSALETGIGLDDFLYVLSGQPPNAERTRELGSQLYRALVVGDVERKLDAARSIARSHGATLRIAVSASGRLADVPWEFLHDGEEFLGLSGVSIVRVEDEMPPGEAYFGPIEKVAVVVSDPDGELNFGSDPHVDQLEATLSAQNVAVAVQKRVTRDALRALIRDDEFDLLYFLGHGTAGQLSLIGSESTETVPLPGDDLANWLRSAKRRVRLVYLNSCSSADSNPAGEAPSGVAQSILRTGRVDNVVAMQAKINPTHAMTIAMEYLGTLVSVHDPESSLSAARDGIGDRFARATPVAYTHLSGWQDLERNRLAALLGISVNGRACLSLNGYQMGVQEEDYEHAMGGVTERLDASNVLFYRGVTLAESDVNASKTIVDLISEVVDAERIDYSVSCAEADATFFFGGHYRVQEVVNRYSDRFCLEHGEMWGFRDSRTERRHEIRRLTDRSYDYDGHDDFGFVEKVRVGSTWFFFFSGIGSRATRGCSYWLASNWRALLEKYGTGPFSEVLRFPGGMSYHYGEPIEPPD